MKRTRICGLQAQRQKPAGHHAKTLCTLKHVDGIPHQVSLSRTREDGGGRQGNGRQC